MVHLPPGVRRFAPLLLVVLTVAALAGLNALAGLVVHDGPASVADGRPSAAATRRAVPEDPPPTGEATTSTAPATTTTTVLAPPDDGKTAAQRTLEPVETITGRLTPKSVVASGTGLFFAQNMMYTHTVSVFDRSFRLVKTIPDTVDLAAFGVEGTEGSYQGAPVEAAFTSDGRYAYVSNYQMYGPGYGNPGSDDCGPGDYDGSFVYRIDTERLVIDQVIAVGAVPKYVAVTPDDRRVLVTNWCGYDLSVVDTATAKEIERVPLGRHPRGIAVAADSRHAYASVMGSDQVAIVNLSDYSIRWLYTGRNPRHVVLSPDGRFLYVTLNLAGEVVKVDLQGGGVVATASPGQAPRSMTISDDGTALYVVNYHSDTVSKLRADDLEVLQDLPVAHHPIGITYDPATRDVWVASYSGVLTVLGDR